MGLEILYLLIPATFILAGIALGMFLWAIRTGQFDDLETPAIRILFDDSVADSGGENEFAPIPERGFAQVAPQGAKTERMSGRPVQQKKNTAQTPPNPD